MLEECLSNGFFVKALRKIDAEDLGAERSGDAADFDAFIPYCSTLMFCALMIWP
jgi:hypothetical protein